MATTKDTTLNKINSIAGYLRVIFKPDMYFSEEDVEADEEYDDDFAVTCYRGQSNATWLLEPSISRGYKNNAENEIFRELMLEAPNEFNNDKYMFDRLVRAQHYGLPTRLLDVSLNPLVALYFACCELNDGKKGSTDGKVFIINVKQSRVKFADSDAISLVSNLARLTDEERERLKPTKKLSPDKFRELYEIKRLLGFVKGEKPYFTNEIKRVDLFKYFFVYPSKNNRRVIAQSGAFMTAGLLNYASPETSNGLKIQEILIPGASKKKILDELDKLNINSRSLFPEIESASKYIKTKYITPVPIGIDS
ncbi:FRG domain-containing protein [Citrobacter freundii]|uniref:FRG domain-containing protein n=1 Tax=Citrobacter freundii TaxID=546 RepID=UPI002938657A|nr:FRG domain-containing protein [Citrobacter freundii]ELQ7798018.1 FRG domain-containing protein [Citrobacter freundii]MEA8858034.1 FRG domain-containing protein [Citrobacter freundii]